MAVKPKEKVKTVGRDLAIAATGCFVGALFDWIVRLF